MSKLHVEQKSVLTLLSEKKADFLIPDYQRPYAWGIDQCQTLWDDLHSFSLPNNNHEEFDGNDDYFLGCIVTYKNDGGRSEVIDGQQRLTTLMLILRAFYEKFTDTPDEKSKRIRESIEKCIWKTDEFGKANKEELKIDSEVATDDDKEEFLYILQNGKSRPDSKSRYASNYDFFKRKIENFLLNLPICSPYLPARILGNCVIFPIESESMDTALRIFSTLNNRGLSLSDADIFKAQFYKYHKDIDRKNDFISDWKDLEEITKQIFEVNSGSPMDELFTRYMYYLRAWERNKSSTTEALRKFYEHEKYKYLKQDNTLVDLRALASFWESVSRQDKERFSDDILKKLFVLKYAPNGMWQNIASVYFLQNRKDDGSLEEERFAKFLDKITAFIFAYTITNPGVNALRTPIYDEMVNIIDNKAVTFSKHKFNEDTVRSYFKNYTFTNQRSITRSIITWHTFTFPKQELPRLNERFHIEHIYPKSRQYNEKSLENEDNLESLGNKVLLEASINIQASDYRFEDKKRIYNGQTRKNKEPTRISEIMENIMCYEDFQESTIESREKDILDKFFDFLRKEELLTDKESSTE